MKRPAFFPAVSGFLTMCAIFFHRIHFGVFICLRQCKSVGVAAGATIASIVSYLSAFVALDRRVLHILRAPSFGFSYRRIPSSILLYIGFSGARSEVYVISLFDMIRL